MQFVGPKTQQPQPISSLGALGLSRELLGNLAARGIDSTNAVQNYTIPALVHQKSDLICIAPTGFGKTLSFIIAVLNEMETAPPMAALNLEDEAQLPPGPRVLVVQPTREQAAQTLAIFRKLGQGLCVTFGGCIGGTREQRPAGVDVVVGTLGAVIGFLKAKTADLRRIELLILDDGDKLFDYTFQAETAYLKQKLAKRAGAMPKTAILSATFPATAQGPISDFLRPNFLSVAIGPKTRHLGPTPLRFSSLNNHVQQFWIRLPSHDDNGLNFNVSVNTTKDAQLFCLLRTRLSNIRDWAIGPHGRYVTNTRVLVFMEHVHSVQRAERSLLPDQEGGAVGRDEVEVKANEYTDRGAILGNKKKKTKKNIAPMKDKYSGFLHKLMDCVPDDVWPFVTLHRRLPQRERLSNLEDFAAGRSPILIATSVAARALDVHGIHLVVNYDMPIQYDGSERVNVRGDDTFLLRHRVVQRALGVYIQRIGRSGRAGHDGAAVNFFDPKWDSGLIPAIREGILVPGNQHVPKWMLPQDTQPDQELVEEYDDWE